MEDIVLAATGTLAPEKLVSGRADARGFHKAPIAGGHQMVRGVSLPGANRSPGEVITAGHHINSSVCLKSLPTAGEPPGLGNRRTSTIIPAQRPRISEGS